jgi:PH (Pleckstrin Homology) domain-containing protein
VSAVPHRMRVVCAVIAAVVVVGMVLAGIFLKASDPTGTVSFRTGDQVALICLGLLIGGGVLLLGRPRVDGDGAGVRVRNILGSHRMGWEQVRSVRFDRNSMWASLSLTSGEEIAVLAVQAVDGERAVAAVEGLRALLDASRPAAEPGPPLLYDD